MSPCSKSFLSSLGNGMNRNVFPSILIILMSFIFPSTSSNCSRFTASSGFVPFGILMFFSNSHFFSIVSSLFFWVLFVWFNKSLYLFPFLYLFLFFFIIFFIYSLVFSNSHFFSIFSSLSFWV